MSAATLNIPIEQGTTFRRILTVRDDDEVPIDLTGWVFSGQIRSRYDSAPALASFTCTLRDQGTYPGQVYLTLTATQTAALPVDGSDSAERTSTTYLYDIEALKANGDTDRVLQGNAVVSPQVTQ